MDVKDLKQVIGEAVFENYEKDSNKGLYPDDMPQDMQQENFDDTVQLYHDAFISNPNLIAQLPALTREEIKNYFDEKISKARDKFLEK